MSEFNPDTLMGIDPGMSTGGAVLIQRSPEMVLDALRLKTPPQKWDREQPGDKQFSDSILRARGQADALLQFIDRHRPGLLAIESFVDLVSHTGKENRLRWQTPLVIGMLDAGIRDLGYEDHQIRYQNPVVLHQMRDERSKLNQANKAQRKRKDWVLVPGDQLISNQHLISAFLHGSWSVER